MYTCAVPNERPHAALECTGRAARQNTPAKKCNGQNNRFALLGSSLLLIYEGDQSYGPANADVRLIDFAHSQMSPSLDTPDDGMLLGLSNIDRYLSNIIARKPSQDETGTATPASPSAAKLQLVA